MLFVFALLALFGELFYLSYKIDESFAENDAFVQVLESDVDLTEVVGTVVRFEPLYRTRSGLTGHENTRVGTILELDNGMTVAVGEKFDFLTKGIELRKAKYKETMVYCLNGKRFSCSFERHINTI